MTFRATLIALAVLTAFPLFAQSKLLHKLLKRNAEKFGEVLKTPEKFEVQIIYTQIDRDENNFPHLKSFTFQLDEKQYYYPASTIKMPVAFMALEKLNKLGIVGLDKSSAMLTGEGHPPQTGAEVDTTSAIGRPTVAHYIKKIFLVSDNDASNRLYEFLGQRYLNEGLWAKGYGNLKITHRLSVSGFDAEANRYTNPISFFSSERLMYHQGEVYSKAEKDFNLNKLRRGKGYYSNGELIAGQFDFSEKNYVSLQDHHDMLKAVMFPEAVPAWQRFDLAEGDYRFLYRVMSERPKESLYPNYPDKPDHYVKFFIFGDRNDEERMPDNIRIFNKVGWAYGFLTDISYIVDFETGVEFMLAATIHVNEDGIFNDDNYEYETVGLPFLANLGRVLYEHEKKRKRKRLPDLSKFKIENYD